MANIFSKIGSAFKGDSQSESDKADLKNSAQKIQDNINAITPQPNFRAAEGPTNRDQSIMTWRLPNGSAIQMYINPQSLEIRESKQINTIRTKGGFVVQYWGANLTDLNIRGITGSSGVQGINILRDIYNSENRAFDLVAANQFSKVQDALSANALNTNDVSSSLAQLTKTMNDSNFILRPSLASLASSILMFYQGVEYRGFFTSFSVTETAERTGMFEYAMEFKSTETRGRRLNTMSWQKEPIANDVAGALLTGVGNAIRGAFGMNQEAPDQFHPNNAPSSFGGGTGNSVLPSLGISSNEQLKGNLF